MRLTDALLVALMLVSPAHHAAAAEGETQSQIRAFIERVNRQSAEFYATGTGQDAREKAQALLAWAFDIPAMAKDAAGANWEQFSEPQRREFLQAFEEDVISAYLRRMKPKGQDATLNFVGHRPPAEGYHFAASRRVVNGKEDQTWIWKLRPEAQSWRIADVLLNGRSAVGAQRQEFANVLKSNNGSFDALMAFMRKRAAQ